MLLSIYWYREGLKPDLFSSQEFQFNAENTIKFNFQRNAYVVKGQFNLEPSTIIDNKKQSLYRRTKKVENL